MGDIGVLIPLIGLLASVGVLAGAFAGAYLFGKTRAQREALTAAKDPELQEADGARRAYRRSDCD